MSIESEALSQSSVARLVPSIRLLQTGKSRQSSFWRMHVSDPTAWKELPVLVEFHRQWWRARGKNPGSSKVVFTRDWENLLTEAGLTHAELRAEAERDARLLAGAGDWSDWLGPDLAPQARVLFQTRHRLAQEWVGHEILARLDKLHPDLQASQLDRTK